MIIGFDQYWNDEIDPFEFCRECLRNGICRLLFGCFVDLLDSFGKLLRRYEAAEKTTQPRISPEAVDKKQMQNVLLLRQVAKNY